MSYLSDYGDLITRDHSAWSGVKQEIINKGISVPSGTPVENIPSYIHQIGGGPVTKAEMPMDYMMYSRARSQTDFETLSNIFTPTSLREFAYNNTNITSIPNNFDFTKIYGSSYYDPLGHIDNAFRNCTNLTGIIDMNGAQPTWINGFVFGCSNLDGVINLSLSNIKAEAVSSTVFPRNSKFHRLTIYNNGILGQLPFKLDLTGDQFNESEMVEFFNSLPQIKTNGNRTIIITNCKCVLDGTLTANDKLIATNKNYILTI